MKKRHKKKERKKVSTEQSPRISKHHAAAIAVITWLIPSPLTK